MPIDAGVDATVDSGFDAQWPVVPGCVNGLPPSPQFDPPGIPPITISCASSSTVITRLSDSNHQGMIFTATLNPPIDGLSIFFAGDLCAFDFDSEIDLNVAQSVSVPGVSLNTILNVILVGPQPQPTYVFPLQINTGVIDFTVDPAVIDFGTVTAGQSVSMPLTVTNAMDGAPLQNVYPTQFIQDSFQLSPTTMSGPSLQPGDSAPLLDAAFSAQGPGTYDTTFLVSAFPTGSVINTACGVIRTVTMHAQVSGSGPP